MKDNLKTIALDDMISDYYRMLSLKGLNIISSNMSRRDRVSRLVNKQTGSIFIMSHDDEIPYRQLLEGLDTVEEAGNDVVPARGLAAGEDDADVELRILNRFALDKLHYGHAIRIGEEGLDFGLVADGLGRCAFDSLDRALEGDGKLGLIGGAGDLKIGFDWHNVLYKMLYVNYITNGNANLLKIFIKIQRIRTNFVWIR